MSASKLTASGCTSGKPAPPIAISGCDSLISAVRSAAQESPPSGCWKSVWPLGGSPRSARIFSIPASAISSMVSRRLSLVSPTQLRWAIASTPCSSRISRVSSTVPSRVSPPAPSVTEKTPGPRLLQMRASGGNLFLLVRLQHRLSLLAGADANRLLHRQDEDLPVPDVAGPGVLQDRLDHHALVLVLNHDLHLQLRSHVDGQTRAPVGLDHPFLAPGSLHLADRQGGKSLVEQLGSDRFERLVADVCLDLLHVHLPASGSAVM